MTVPLCARSVAAVIGGLLVLAAWSSAVETLIVPRPGGGRLARRMALIVNGAFRLAASVTTGYQRRDRVLARQAAAIMLTVLGAWLGTAFAGYWLLMWPLVRGGPARTQAGSGSAPSCPTRSSVPCLARVSGCPPWRSNAWPPGRLCRWNGGTAWSAPTASPMWLGGRLRTRASASSPRPGCHPDPVCSRS